MFALKSFKLTWNIFSLTLDSVDDPDTCIKRHFGYLSITKDGTALMKYDTTLNCQTVSLQKITFVTATFKLDSVYDFVRVSLNIHCR